MKTVFARRAGGICAAIVLSVSASCFGAPQALEQAQVRAGFTLDQLMKSLAQRRHGEVDYEETDYLAVLDRPLKSSGMLIYDAPDHLEKRTIKPKPQSLTLDGDEMTVQRGRRKYQMQVSAYPKLAPLLDAMRDTLAGNEAALEKVFKVGFTGTAEDWKLQLMPLDEELARDVKEVEVQGAQDEIRSVEILQVSGDRSVMTLGRPADAAGTAR